MELVVTVSVKDQRTVSRKCAGQEQVGSVVQTGEIVEQTEEYMKTLFSQAVIVNNYVPFGSIRATDEEKYIRAKFISNISNFLNNSLDFDQLESVEFKMLEQLEVVNHDLNNHMSNMENRLEAMLNGRFANVIRKLSEYKAAVTRKLNKKVDKK